jgi:biotin carboxylase
MTDQPIILAGFVGAALPELAKFLPERSVVIVEEPDVVRKRGVRETVAATPLVRELVEWEHQLPGAADAFFAARPDLHASAVIPQVEYATPFAARLAERYGVVGAGFGAAQLMRDKSLLRKVTRAAGIANPASEEVDSPEQVAEFLASAAGPVVLKPADRQGAVGTLILTDPAEVAEAWVECQDQDEGVMVPDRPRKVRMLVEEYVAGHEYSVEMVVRDGEPLFTNITDKVLYPGPRPIELGHVLPADVPAELAAKLTGGTEAVLRATGFGTGFVHCEWIVRDGTPVLVECAGRFPGDFIMEMIERAYDQKIGQHYFDLMRGLEPPEFPRTAPQAAAVRYARAEPGEIVSVTGVEASAALPGVIRCEIGPPVGSVVAPMRNSWHRIGASVVLAPTAAEAAQLAEKAMDQVQVVIRPVGG